MPDNTIIFINGLREGNSILDNNYRNGTLVVIMDFEKWKNNPNESIIADGVSDENGNFEAKILKLSEPLKVRIHIRDFGFKYLGFDTYIQPSGFFYSAKLEIDHFISEDAIDKKYNSDIRKKWDTEGRFLKAQQEIYNIMQKYAINSNTKIDTTLDSQQHIKAFISYSHDNTTHKHWVLSLADSLQSNGVYVFFDQYDLDLGKSLDGFMLKLKESDYIITILTENYKNKVEMRVGGVSFEHSLITQEIMKNQDTVKIIPILRNGNNENSLPSFFPSLIFLDMRNDNEFDEKFDELLRRLYEKPVIKRPPLGNKPIY